MRRPLPVMERYLELTALAGSEVNFVVTGPDGREQSINVNLVFREMYDALRALEQLVEASNLTKAGGMGGLGVPPQA